MFTILLQEGGPLPGPETALVYHSEMNCPRRPTCWQSKRFYWERAPGWRAVGKGARTALSHGLQFYGDGISFRVVFGQSFWLRVLPGGTLLVQPRWILERILGGGQTCGVSFWPFPNSSGWWRRISPLFLTRTSCRKTAHANSYYGAGQGETFSLCASPNKHIWLGREEIKATDI